MLDAVDLNSGTHDYYHYYPYHDDSGYLVRLVENCKRQISELKAYETVLDPIKKYINLYIDLQSLKHLEPVKREKRLKEWASSHAQQYPYITCWELSAAAGSTLLVFLLFAAAFDPSLSVSEVNSIIEAYFPWVCGLHILLDYYIDSNEDHEAKDLNFTNYYNNLEECEERIAFFIHCSFEKCALLKHPKFHHTVIHGLLAMYLSDQKASNDVISFTSQKLLKKGDKKTLIYYYICKFLRRVEKF